MDRRKKSIVLKAIAFLFVGIGSYFVFINREIDPHYGIPFWIVAFIIMVISELVGKYKNPNISKSEKVSSIIPYVLFCYNSNYNTIVYFNKINTIQTTLLRLNKTSSAASLPPLRPH